MLQIRPVPDLRNKFPDIEKIVNAGEPVYLTKNGYGAMVYRFPPQAYLLYLMQLQRHPSTLNILQD